MNTILPLLLLSACEEKEFAFERNFLTQNEFEDKMVSDNPKNPTQDDLASHSQSNFNTNLMIPESVQVYQSEHGCQASGRFNIFQYDDVHFNGQMPSEMFSVDFDFDSANPSTCAKLQSSLQQQGLQVYVGEAGQNQLNYLGQNEYVYLQFDQPTEMSSPNSIETMMTIQYQGEESGILEGIERMSISGDIQVSQTQLVTK